MLVPPPPRGGARRGALTLAALGIVFGDIGTSPLYAMRESLHGHSGLAVDAATVIGVASTIVWALILVIAIKYMVFVMRADVHGEGGVLALTALLDQARRRAPAVLVGLGIFGTALLYGDGAITPAISVLSAVEGLEVVDPRLDPFVIPLALGLLVALFAVQSRGTAALGAVFGKVMLLWFGTLALLGAMSIAATPAALAALNPIHAVQYLTGNGFPAFASLGAIFLVITGGEALYADMGHFGRRPIATGWFSLVMPSLMLNYLGQAALLIRDPAAISNPFVLLAPGWARLALVLLATAATVIASQALISGVFSLSVQAVQMNYLPRLRVIHTSDTERGQVYLPAVNWALLLACILLVVGFGSSSALAAAYGVAVTATMVLTTILFAWVAIHVMGWRQVPVILGAMAFGVIDLAFLGANLLKLGQGGWLPLLAGATVAVLMTTWHRGRQLLIQGVGLSTVSLSQFLGDLGPDIRTIPGTAVFLYSRPGVVPPAMRNVVRHFSALHERVVLLTVVMDSRPHRPPAARFSSAPVHRNGRVVEQVTLTYGYRDRIDVPEALRATLGRPGGLDPAHASFFIGSERVRPTDRRGMALWREHLFAVMLRNAADATAFFNLPPMRTTSVGESVEI